jgi:hypothetical protein
MECTKREQVHTIIANGAVYLISLMPISIFVYGTLFHFVNYTLYGSIWKRNRIQWPDCNLYAIHINLITVNAKWNVSTYKRNPIQKPIHTGHNSSWELIYLLFSLGQRATLGDWDWCAWLHVSKQLHWFDGAQRRMYFGRASNRPDRAFIESRAW